MANDLAEAIKQASGDLDAAKRAEQVGSTAKAQVLVIIADSPSADPKIAKALADELRGQIRTGTGKAGSNVESALKKFPNVRGVTVTTAADLARARDAANASAALRSEMPITIRGEVQGEKVIEKQIEKNVERLAQRRLLAKFPVIGIAFAVYLVSEDLAHGDTTNAVLDALGPIGGVGQAAGLAQIALAESDTQAKRDEKIVKGMEQFKPGYPSIFTGAVEIGPAPPPPVHCWPY